MTDARPIFILSASWRSGSTLLQRYVTASGQALIWGETGGALDALRDAAAGWEHITADGSRRFASGWGGQGEAAYRQVAGVPKAEHPHLWIANLTPPYQEILEALRKMILDLYATRAGELGYARFGIKETRCDIATAQFLRVLFPDARFVFLVRDPLAVMLSIKRRDWMGRRPGTDTLRYYAEHWRRRASGFRQADFGMALRYEDFIGDAGLRSKLMQYLEIDNVPSDDFVQTSKVDWTTRDRSDLTWREHWLTRHWLAAEMAAWGYA